MTNLTRGLFREYCEKQEQEARYILKPGNRHGHLVTRNASGYIRYCWLPEACMITNAIKSISHLA